MKIQQAFKKILASFNWTKIKLTKPKIKMSTPKGIWALMLPVFSKKQSILHNAASTLDVLKFFVVFLSVFTAYYAMPGDAGVLSAITVLVSDPIAFLFLVLGFAFMGILMMSIFAGQLTKKLLRKVRARFIIKYTILTSICFVIVAVIYYFSYDRSQEGAKMYLTEQTASRYKPPKTQAQIIGELEMKYSQRATQHRVDYDATITRITAQREALADRELTARADSSNYYKGKFSYKLIQSYTKQAHGLDKQEENAYQAMLSALALDKEQRASELPMLKAQIAEEWDVYRSKVKKSEQTAEVGVAAFTIVGLVLTALSSIFRADAFRSYAGDIITTEAERVRIERGHHRDRSLRTLNTILMSEKAHLQNALNLQRNIGFNSAYVEEGEKGERQVYAAKAKEGQSEAKDIIKQFAGSAPSQDMPEPKSTPTLFSKLQKLKSNI